MNYKTKEIFKNQMIWTLIAVLLAFLFGSLYIVQKGNMVKLNTLEKAKVECHQNKGNRVEDISKGFPDRNSPDCKIEYVCVRADHSAYTFFVNCVK
jgi:hypothetical protein